MLQPRSILTVADNTGAKKAMLVGLPGKGNRRLGYIGDMITVVIKDAIPHGQIKKSELVPAVIIRTRKEKRRTDGSYIRFDDNACVILAAKTGKDPRGTRIFGPVAKEIKDAGYGKIASLAEEIY